MKKPPKKKKLKNAPNRGKKEKEQKGKSDDLALKGDEK